MESRVVALGTGKTDDNGKKFKSTVRAAYDFDGHLYAINNGLLVAELDKGNPVDWGWRTCHGAHFNAIYRQSAISHSGGMRGF